MLKIDKKWSNETAYILLIYPITVVSFKLVAFPLQAKMTLLVILLLMTTMKLVSNNYFALLLSVAVYLYVRILFISKSLAIDTYVNSFGQHIKSLILINKNVAIDASNSNLLRIEFIELALEKSILYIASIALVFFLYQLINNSYIKEHFNVFILITMLYFVYAWFSYIDVENIIVIFLIAVLIYSSNYNKISHLISLLILMILILNISNSIISYEYISGKVGKVAPQILVLRSDYKDRESFFNFEKSIYYPLDSKLGGSVTIDSNKIIMNVRTAEDILYLRGSVKDTYTGHSWENSSIDYSKFESARRYGEKNYHSDKLKSAYIKYEDMKSLSVFSTIGVLEFSLDESKLRVDKDESVYYKKGLFEESIDDYSIIFTLEDRKIFEKEKYLRLADSVSDRTKQLALNLTKNSKDDMEKIDSIKRYLISEYSYSLQVDENDDYSDFVDNFLFEGKRGYCTYFSSSLAILARINGIPSRYVEGYIVSPQSFEDSKYVIREDRAHAWSEVYIEGSGWLIVDATPIYDFDEEEIEDFRQKKEESKEIIDKNSDYDKVEEEEIVARETSQETIDNKSIYTLIATLICLILLMFKRRKIKGNQVSNREKAINIIYKIDDILDDRLEMNKNNKYTVYKKMDFYNKKFAQVFDIDMEIQSKKNAIIKDVSATLYNCKELTDDELKNLEKYLYIIKKAYSNK